MGGGAETLLGRPIPSMQMEVRVFRKVHCSVTNLFTNSHCSEWTFIPVGICAVTSNVMHIS